MVSSRGLPPVRICNARIVFFARSRPETVRHRAAQPSVSSGAERHHPEQVVESAVPFVDFVEPAGCARQQEEPGIVLKRLAEAPSGIVVCDVPEHHVEVLDQQYEAPAFPVREILKDAQAAIPECPVIANFPPIP